jgi:hypothetical protein
MVHPVSTSFKIQAKGPESFGATQKLAAFV